MSSLHDANKLHSNEQIPDSNINNNTMNHNSDNEQSQDFAEKLFHVYVNGPNNSNDITSLLTSFITPETSTYQLKKNFEAFLQLRYEWFGIMTNNNNTGVITNNNNTYNITNNHITTNINSTNHNSTVPVNPMKMNEHLDALYDIHLFSGILLTNSPTMIDIFLSFIPIDFTPLNIPHDQIETVQHYNTIYTSNHRYQPLNYILNAIVMATEQGHYETIKHLIEKYQLSPLIPISGHYYQTTIFTNLFFHSTMSTNLKLIEYLLPLCFNTTHINILTLSIFNIAKEGHFNLIRHFQQHYNINLVQLQHHNSTNILHHATQSSNIELIDYLIEIGVDMYHQDRSQNTPLSSAIQYLNWPIVQHLVTKHNYDINTLNLNRLQPLFWLVLSFDTTIEQVDFAINTFGTGVNINNPYGEGSYLCYAIGRSSLDVIKHLINKYQVDPLDYDNIGRNIIHSAVASIPCQSIECLQYLLQFNANINDIDDQQTSPIEIAVRHCNVEIIDLLITHNAMIHDIHRLVNAALLSANFTVVQYLIEKYQSKIDFKLLRCTPMSDKRPLLHGLVCHPKAIDLIRYLLSLEKFDINEEYQQHSLIYHALKGSHALDLDLIKLLVTNGAKITIHDWLVLFQFAPNRIGSITNFNIYFNLLDYFNKYYGFNIQQYDNINTKPISSNLPSLTTTMNQSTSSQILSSTNTLPLSHPLLQYTSNTLKFVRHVEFRSVMYDMYSFCSTLIYRTFIKRYHLNINQQDHDTKNTVLHYLAKAHQTELIQFTFINSHEKPNIFLLNNKGETFLHIICGSNGSSEDGIQFTSEIENIIDYAVLYSYK